MPNHQGLWPVAGLMVGVLATLPHFANPLNTSDAVEIADHVIPGLVVMAVSAVTLALLKRSSAPALKGRSGPSGPSVGGGSFMFVAGLVVVLAGLWMVATHVPLIAQASRGEVDWGGALYHSGSGLVVLAFGMAWVAAHWGDL